jgi:hypothetical protein
MYSKRRVHDVFFTQQQKHLKRLGGRDKNKLLLNEGTSNSDSLLLHCWL